MSVKYQIFVSSTYDDLRSERDQVIKAALEMGHIPVSMEMFSAADEEQWKIITSQIDQSDYYAVIIAHRYGSTIDGVSYTEKEYDYAVNKGVPVISFIVEGDVSWSPEMIDTQLEKKEALERFKAKVKKKPVGFWRSDKDLHGKFSIALMKLIATSPRPGWAKADEIIGPEVMREITRLSSENSILRNELSDYKEKELEKESNKNQEIVDILRRNNAQICIRKDGEKEWGNYKDTTLYQIFYEIAPILISEATSIVINKRLALQVCQVANQRNDYLIPKNYVDQWLSDLACLKLIKPSDKKHSVHDENDYWILTELGLDVHASLRRLVLELGSRPGDMAEEPEYEDEDQ